MTDPGSPNSPLHRLYHWMIWRANTPHARMFLFALAFVESSFFPLPPDILLIAMVLARREKWFRYFLICLAGSVLGGIFGYWLGYAAWQAVDQWFFAHVFSEGVFNRVRDLYTRYDFWVVFTAGFTPIPYKVFTITAGVAGIDFMRFVLASLFGRGGRFVLVSYLLYHFGPPIRTFIEKYLNVLTIVFTVLLIAGFYVLKVVLH